MVIQLLFNYIHLTNIILTNVILYLRNLPIIKLVNKYKCYIRVYMSSNIIYFTFGDTKVQIEGMGRILSPRGPIVPPRYPVYPGYPVCSLQISGGGTTPSVELNATSLYLPQVGNSSQLATKRQTTISHCWTRMSQ